MDQEEVLDGVSTPVAPLSDELGEPVLLRIQRAVVCVEKFLPMEPEKLFGEVGEVDSSRGMSQAFFL